MYLKLMFMFFSAVAAVQGRKLTDRIIGSHDAEVGEFPYQISLQYANQHVCGGSILNSRWILTAGHCITDIMHVPWFSYVVVAGILSFSDQGQSIKVKTIIVHPGYLRKIGPYDIALLELESELQFGDNVQPVQLPEKNVIPEGSCILSGWGSICTNDISLTPLILQTVDLPLISIEECSNALKAMYGTDFPLDETNICTGPLVNGGKGPCLGDSGGPLVKKDADGKVTQVGIVSWGNLPCGSAGNPSIFTRVSAYIDWINAYIVA